jgi:hypothetical protein
LTKSRFKIAARDFASSYVEPGRYSTEAVGQMKAGSPRQERNKFRSEQEPKPFVAMAKSFPKGAHAKSVFSFVVLANGALV